MWNLSCLPQNVHVLVLPGLDVLAQKSEQLWKARLRTRPREAWKERAEGQSHPDDTSPRGMGNMKGISFFAGLTVLWQNFLKLLII